MRNGFVIRCALALACICAAGAASAANSGPQAPQAQQTGDDYYGIALMSARIQAYGNAVSRIGVVAGEKKYTGVYEIEFERDVASCAYSVTPTIAISTDPLIYATATAAPIAQKPRFVQVQIYNSAAKYINHDFHIIVFCGR
jgi:hypothetical protein